MSDKYEEFKEWIRKMEIESIAVQQIDWRKLFKAFEEDYQEKHRKEEIMETIWQTLQENTIQLSYEIDGVHCKEHPAEAVYNKLKEKDMIK